MKEVILCKYGEIVLKGANRVTFESALLKEIRKRRKLSMVHPNLESKPSVI